MTSPPPSRAPSFVSGFACHLPSRVVTNAELARMVGCDADWIRNTSGIEERRFAEEDESVVDLAVAAARPCLAAAGGPTIGLVIVASGTADRRFPGPATRVAQALSLGTIPALDLPMPSAGALFGIALASQLSQQLGDVLVVGAEKMSSVTMREGTNPNVAVLFGDGAGACVISRSSGLAKIIDAVMHSDGTFNDVLQLGFAGPLQMDGRTVILQAARKLPRVIQQILDANRVPTNHVAAFLLHQANLNLTRQVARALGISEDRCFSNIERYGNTSSASVLIALAEWASVVGFQTDVPVVMAAFGAGLNWGSVLLQGV